MTRGWDVIVVGGGLAGIAAATSAAHVYPQARVLLLEQSDVLGGNATQAFVHTICGLYLYPEPGTKAEQLEYANPGFASRMANWLQLNGAALPAELHGKVGVLPTVPDRMIKLLEAHCNRVAKKSGLTVSTNTHLEKVETTDTGFSCQIRNSDSTSTLHTRFILDTSGDAAAAAGVEALTDTPDSGEVQHPTYIFQVTGADPRDLKGYNRLKLGLAFTKASQSGRLPSGASSVLVRPATTVGEAYISLNMPKPENGAYNPLDPHCIADLTATARMWAEILVQFLREEFPSWAECKVLKWPRKMGIRETRRIRGRYVMSAEDVLQGKTREDEVARSTWPIELWNFHTGAQFSYPTGPSSIPLDALISASHNRLGMAGRCMSGTHEALGALRVLGTALATGEAIGLAAAWALKHDTTLDHVSAETVQGLRNLFSSTELP